MCKFVVFAVCLLWGMSEQWVVAFITKPTSLMWEKSTFHYPRHSTSNEKTLVTLCLWAINKLKVIIDGMTKRKLRKRGILIVENLTDKWAFIPQITSLSLNYLKWLHQQHVYSFTHQPNVFKWWLMAQNEWMSSTKKNYWMSSTWVDVNTLVVALKNKLIV